MTSHPDPLSIGSASSNSPPSTTSPPPPPPPPKPPTPFSPLSPPPPSAPLHEASTAPSTWRDRLYTNRGLFILLASQFFGSVMALAARLLSTGHSGPQHFHATQILFIRQSITTAGCILWMWYHRTPNWPFGPRGIRLLLVARGVAGFFGVFGLYYSLAYLDLSDATVITFLAPMVVAYACSVIPALREPFTRAHAAATAVSFLGVVMIARPASLFRKEGPAPEEPDAHRRLVAVLVALLGVLGAAAAYTTIRWIGKRAHPLVTVFYFSSCSVVVSLVVLLSVPSIGGIILPKTGMEWVLLGGIGVTGFLTQFLLTRGLQLEKAGRGTNMVYTQMLFAVFWERIVWGNVPGLWSVLGSGCILGSAVFVGVRNEKEKVVRVDEEVGLVETEDEEGSGDEGSEGLMLMEYSDDEHADGGVLR